MHIFQVGAGSGGIVVLDLLARDERVSGFTLVEPDVYQPHNVHRHLFPATAVGRLKAELAAEWIAERRAGLRMDIFPADLTDPARAGEFTARSSACHLGVCAADNETAKYAFDALMRAAGKPWTLGEVLSGGIGGWVHRFSPGGACYGCVASRLKRTLTETPSEKPPDYSAPGGPARETRIPAARASIAAIAGLHATATLDILDGWAGETNGAAVSWLFTLRRVPGVFEEPYRSFRFKTERSASCLVCGRDGATGAGGNLDVALDQALGRLAPQ